MALLHDARLVPTKPEMLRAWVPTRPWWRWAESPLTVVGAYRFDDPAGAVGIETHLLQIEDGPVVQVALTYRDTPLDWGDFVTTLQHSVLGERWVYDGCSDPVYAAALATAMLTGGTQAELVVRTAEGETVRPATTTAHGTGRPGTPVPSIDAPGPTAGERSTTMSGVGITLELRHEIDVDTPAQGDYVDAPARGEYALVGTWPGLGREVVLATAVVDR